MANWVINDSSFTESFSFALEADEIPATEMNHYIERAVLEAHGNKVTGKAVTPWLLARIMELTEGRSLETNIALIRNNANLAGKIAVELGD